MKPTATSAAQIATIAAQSQKVTSSLPGGPKIRIVAPTSTTGAMPKVSSLSTLHNLASGDKKIISTSPAFSGGTTVIKKVVPKPQVPIQNVSVKALPIPIPVAVPKETLSIQRSLENEEILPKQMDFKQANDNQSEMVQEPQSEESKMDTEIQSKDEKMDQESNQPNAAKPPADSSWTLPPIDMKALKLPQQLNKPDAKRPAKSEKGQKKTSKSKAKDASKGPKPVHMASAQEMPGMKRVSTPKFSLSSSPSDSSLSGTQSPDVQADQFMSNSMGHGMKKVGNATNLPLRPSEIDLHEMKLSGSSASLSQIDTGDMNFGGDNHMHPQWNQGMQGSQTGSQFSGNQYQSNTGQMSSGYNQSRNMPISSNSNPQINTSTSNAGNFFNPGLPDDISSQNSQMTNQGQNSMNQSMMPQMNQGGMFSNNQNIYGAFGAPTYIDNQRMNNSGMPGFGNMGFNNPLSSVMGPGMGNALTNPMSINQAMSQAGPMPVGQQSRMSTDIMTSSHGNQAQQNVADYTMSGIHNNSSFLSELTETDENFLSQLDESSQGSGGDSSQGIPSSSSYGNTSIPSNSSALSVQNNMSGNFMQQAGQMNNMDMFSQQNQSFFPKFGNNQFNRNTNFGNQPNMGMSQQGGFPAGSMYPMGGMMQPGMFPYPTFAPYPYAPMMAPMPYYPMPFQPQYGAQGGMGAPAGNMGQGAPMGQSGNSGMGLPTGNQGDLSFQ